MLTFSPEVYCQFKFYHCYAAIMEEEANAWKPQHLFFFNLIPLLYYFYSFGVVVCGLCPHLQLSLRGWNMCSLCPAVLPHDSFMTCVCWYLTHCVGLLCSMPSALHLGGGGGISGPRLLICYSTHCGTFSRGGQGPLLPWSWKQNSVSVFGVALHLRKCWWTSMSQRT